MKVTIQIAEADDARAWALLLRHSAGVALPGRTFVVTNEAVEALRQAAIRFRIVSDERPELTQQGATSGERI